MNLDAINRHSAPPPSDIHKYLVDPDDLGIYDGIPENTVEIESQYYPAPLANYLGRRHVKNGDVVVDVGCGKNPISAEMLRQKGNDFSDVRVIALDGRDIGEISSNVVKTIGDTRRFLLVACDLNRLNGDTLSQNGNGRKWMKRPECGRRIDSLQEFLADKGGVDSVKADVLFFGNVLHSIDLGEPVDFLLDKVRTGGKIVIAGTPDSRWPKDQCPPEGRRMADFLRYLEAEGHKILLHEYCGYVLNQSILTRIAGDVVRPVCEATKFGKNCAIDDEALIKSIISRIVEASKHGVLLPQNSLLASSALRPSGGSNGIRFGSFGIGGGSRLCSTGYTQLRSLAKEPVSHHVSIPITFSTYCCERGPEGPGSIMFAPQEVIVAEKAAAKSGGRRLEGGLTEARKTLRRILFAFTGRI